MTAGGRRAPASGRLDPETGGGRVSIIVREGGRLQFVQRLRVGAGV
ncbi:MAG: hypothetical protein MUE51_08515 [Thermoleophilia bacterium]|jgi:hypothetical protein|nr:hypothetical protein [Thermoleophilia bacterium]